jgi:hypothetical protein
MKKLTVVSPLLLMLGVGCSDGGAGLDAGVVPDAGQAPADSGVRPPPDAGQGVELPKPSLINVSPRTGPERGGTRVTLRGANLIAPADVYFGEALATSVVVLDEVSIAATAPAGAVGGVTVKVVTAGGEATLPDGFFYHKELRLDAVSPARVPEEGGVQVTLTGTGFDADTLVYLNREPLRGVVVVDDATLTGYAPALAPGRPEIRLVNRAAEVRRSDLLYVFATPDIAGVAPGYGPTTGRAAQELLGQGLTGATEVQVGGAVAGGLELFADDRVGFLAPALAEGAHDVAVDNGDAQATLPGGYIAYDAANPGLALLGATPNKASSAGGDQLTVVGRGFGADAQVAVGGVRAQVLTISAHAVVIIVPAGLPVGWQDVEIITNNRSAVGTGLFEVYDPIEVLGVSPDRGPVEGGTAVTITGSGFVPGVEVRIADVPLVDVQVVSATELSAVTVAGASGTHDVVVKSRLTQGVLPDGFTFEAPFEVIRIEPTEGSIAGNTYVTVLGRGFSAPVAVTFGANEGLAPTLENGGVIGVRTQPANSGAVDVTVESGGERVVLPRAFSFYDPRLITGGAWGGPIEGSVNVAVMNFDGQPIQNMVVQLGFDADPRYRALTDANGLATVSSPELRGAQTITAGANGVEFVTFMELNAKNLTMVASPYPSVMPDDAPRSPCPEPATAPSVSGRIFKFKSPLDPVTMPGWQPLVRITYTQSSVFGANPPQPPDQIAYVFADGQSYRITVMRVGTVAVYAVLGDYNPETGQFLPRRMGIAKSVPVAPENETQNIDIDLEIPLDQSTLLRLDNPPTQPGESINAVFPFLNLGSDGVIPFPAVALQGTGNILVDRLPAVSEAEFIYMGGSFTWDLASGALQNPYSLNLIETAAPFEEGVDLGPYLDMPQNLSPKPGELIQGGVISWDQGGVVPDIAIINVVDIFAAGGCCCMDLNQNGQCEAAEPEQCGGLPQQSNRWSIYGQGGLMSYVMPPMPAPLQAFEPPKSYGYLIQQAVAPRFNYNEFIYNQFSPFFWKSWSVDDSAFTAKEETD